MIFSKNSVFYIKGRKMLDEFVARGGKVEELSNKDEEYRYIKNSKVYDEHGNLIGLEDKFALLGHPRASKRSYDLRGDLIKEIQEYIDNGGSLHIERKKLPFYERLHSYSIALKREGKILTHEQIMKEDLGFKEYSEICYRCKELKLLKQYEDEEGYVDAYRKNEILNSYVKDLAISLEIPYYLVITLLADKKLKSYEIQVDRIKFIEKEIQNYAIQNGSFVGVKRSNPKIYNDFEYLARYFNDGTGQRLTKADWLDFFGLSEVDHRFRDVKPIDDDIDDIMRGLKQRYQDKKIIIKDLDVDDYRKIVRKAVALDISVSRVFELYGLKCNGINIPRLSRVELEQIPYFEEMKQRRNEIVCGLASKDGLTKEEMFEIKVKAVQQVYEEYKQKIASYLPALEYYDKNEATNNS